MGLAISITSQLYSQTNNEGTFSAICNSVDSLTLSQTPNIYLHNDSIIIKDVIYNQCCPGFALDVSEIINDSIWVSFSDTATITCDCMCNFVVKINAGVTNSNGMKVNYNGNWYSALHEDYMPLVEVNKKWNSLMLISGLDDVPPTRIENIIKSDETRAFCWNGKFYHKVNTKYTSNNNMNLVDTIMYIREANGKVYLSGQGQPYADGCDEALIYNFTANVGDTVTLGFDSIQYVVIPSKYSKLHGRRVLFLAELSELEMSGYTLWIEGIGDTRGLFQSTKSLYIDGTTNILTCCGLGDSLVYQNQDYPNCGKSASVETMFANQINIYPNPASNKIIVNGIINDQMNYQIIDVLGSIVQEGTLRTEINLNLKNDSYFLIIRKNEDIIKTEKLIINCP